MKTIFALLFLLASWPAPHYAPDCQGTGCCDDEDSAIWTRCEQETA